jgi:hypothetical protein
MKVIGGDGIRRELETGALTGNLIFNRTQKTAAGHHEEDDQIEASQPTEKDRDKNPGRRIRRHLQPYPKDSGRTP